MMDIRVLDDLPLMEVDDTGGCSIDCPVCSSIVTFQLDAFWDDHRTWRERQDPATVAAIVALSQLADLLAEEPAIGIVRCPGCGALFLVTVTAEDHEGTGARVQRVLHIALAG